VIIAVLPDGVIGAPHERKPNIDRAGREHLRGHHADHGVRLISEIEGATERVGIPLEEPLPKPIADDCEEWSPDAIFFFRKGPSQLGLQPDHFEKIRRDQASADLLGRASLQAAQVK
jgi:hypothetical protein